MLLVHDYTVNSITPHCVYYLYYIYFITERMVLQKMFRLVDKFRL